MTPRHFACLTALVACLPALPARADIPYTTDDPGVLGAGEFEVIAYSDGSFADGDYNGETGVDFSIGIGHGIHLQAILPLVQYGTQPDRFAVGDPALQAKIEVIAAPEGRPSVTIAPTLTLPIGDKGREHVGVDLPVWVGVESGDWSIYGGGGYSFSSRTDGGDLPFGGLVASRRLGQQFSLGAEIYTEDPRGGNNFLISAGPGVTWDFVPGMTLSAGAQAILANSAANGDATVFIALRYAH